MPIPLHLIRGNPPNRFPPVAHGLKRSGHTPPSPAELQSRTSHALPVVRSNDKYSRSYDDDEVGHCSRCSLTVLTRNARYGALVSYMPSFMPFVGRTSESHTYNGIRILYGTGIPTPSSRVSREPRRPDSRGLHENSSDSGSVPFTWCPALKVACCR